MDAAKHEVKHTALYDYHVELGARMGEFAGFEMPLWYSGIKDEHLAVRNKVGIFDLSHMGEIFISGRQAFDLVQYLTCNDIRRIGDGQCQYTLLPTPEGGVVDDLIAYQLSPEEYMLVVNASNIDKDYAWIEKHNSFNCEVVNRSDEMSLVAVQGPRTDELLTAFGLKTIKSQKPFTFRRIKLQGNRITVAGTGYTGERGFELIVENKEAPWLWGELLKAGAEFDAQPIGLGARDTLRLEMAYSLYGNELSDSISVLEANLGWTVRFGPDFIGREILLKQHQEGVKRTIAGLVVAANTGAPRHGSTVYAGGELAVGTVTSGSFSPSLERGIGLALIQPEHAEVGGALEVEIRGKRTAAKVVELPFYQPAKS
jgi:aminomethyltransferase